MPIALTRADFADGSFTAVAKYLKRHWPDGDIKLAQAREILANCLGYPDVHQAEQSASDVAVPADLVQGRAAAEAVLRTIYQLPADTARDLTTKLPLGDLSCFRECRNGPAPATIVIRQADVSSLRVDSVPLRSDDPVWLTRVSCHLNDRPVFESMGVCPDVHGSYADWAKNNGFSFCDLRTEVMFECEVTERASGLLPDVEERDDDEADFPEWEDHPIKLGPFAADSRHFIVTETRGEYSAEAWEARGVRDLVARAEKRSEGRVVFDVRTAREIGTEGSPEFAAHREWATDLAEQFGWDTPLYRADAIDDGNYRREPIDPVEACRALFVEKGPKHCSIFIGEQAAVLAVQDPGRREGQDAERARDALFQLLAELEALPKTIRKADLRDLHIAMEQWSYDIHCSLHGMTVLYGSAANDDSPDTHPDYADWAKRLEFWSFEDAETRRLFDETVARAVDEHTGIERTRAHSGAKKPA